MKIIKLSCLLCLAAFCFASCDNFDEDEYLVPLAGSTDEQVEISKTQDFQAVLLDEFTAWACNNCPSAARELATLEERFSDKLIPVAIHSGALAKPGRSNQYLDLTTEYGNSLASAISSWPAGIINRDNVVLQHGQWEEKIESELNNSHILNIGLGVKVKNSKILVGTELSFLQDVNKQILMTIMVLEDNIVGTQLDGSQKITDYVFNNVLRNNPLVNLPVNQDNILSGEKINKTYAVDIDTEQGWNLDNCKVVVIVTDKQSGKVLQANTIDVED